MRTFLYTIPALFSALCVFPQNFTRSELPTQLKTPWEMTYGPDGFLWITEEAGTVSRVNTVTGEKKVVYTAPDYSPGHPEECCTQCYNPDIGKGTLGLALHPDFMTPGSAYIYYMYSYNSGTTAAPKTRFKVRRLSWDAASAAVLSSSDVVTDLPTGYDHLGGRMLAVKQNGSNYLFVAIGDNGVSETNFPDCYVPDSLNPNNKCQDPLWKSGKIHRFNMDGSVPADNPLPGNSFYTRGHRNPQGLAYNLLKEQLYSIEHGDRTDDEVNLLRKGMNYGWKHVRGYHADNNFPGESTFVNGYTPYPGISNDQLVEPIYAWSPVTMHSSSDNSKWGTVAPSDAVYYGMHDVEDFRNSLLVVTLKKGEQANREVYRMKLNADGTALSPGTASDPNPRKYFTEDEAKNGRLRDIAVSPDGRQIFLINNGGADRDKITVYTYDGPTSVAEQAMQNNRFEIYPNPCANLVQIDCTEPLSSVEVLNAFGQKQSIFYTERGLNLQLLSAGCYLVRATTAGGTQVARTLVKE